MSASLPDFTSSQWEFLSVMAAFDMPVSLDVIAQLVQLPPSHFFELMRTCESLSWIYQDETGAVGLTNTLPQDARSKIQKINSINKLIALAEHIKLNHLADKIPQKAYDNLLMHSRQKGLTLRDEMSLTIKTLKEGQRDFAKKHMRQIDLLLPSVEAASAENAWFIPASIRLAEYCIARGVEISIVIKLLTKTIVMAEAVGDQRSWAMAHLILGRACWFQGRITDAVSYLALGKEKTEELGDQDILAYASWFIAIYYVLQGYLNKAESYLKAVTQHAMQKEEYILAYEAPILLVYCDINRGDFHRAIGTIDFFRRAAIKRKDYYSATFYRAQLGIGLWVIGKREEAIFHLEGTRTDALAADNIVGYWVSLHVLSCLYLHEGNFDKGLPLFEESLKIAGQAEIVNYVFHPIFLESYFNAEQAGCKLPDEWRFDAFFERIMAEPNIDLQGVALRLRAVRGVAAGEDEELILKDLQDSEALLEKCEDSLQLAKTKMEMVRYYLRNQNDKKARSLANEVYYRELTGYSEMFFPDDLEFLLEDEKMESAGGRDYGTSLEPIFRILEELFSAPDDAMRLELFLSTLSRFFRAERSGVFVFGEEKQQTPELRTARNLSRSIIGDQNFHHSMAMIMASYRGKKPILSKGEMDAAHALDKGCLSAMCLPLLTATGVRAVLYFDNSYLPNCFDFVSLPMLESLGHHLAGILEKQEARAAASAQAESSQQNVRIVLPAPSDFSGVDIIIKDQKMIRLLNQARRLAESEAPILILGETGSGKEVIAQWIHNNSARHDKPFVVVDLTTIPENLMESELFGHEKGAFTGAHSQTIGRVEISEGGTLFFDEIGEISLQLQVKLLRLLEQKTFTRVGGTKTKRADFRLVAATNRNLFDEVRAGRFREDLYYRLNTLELTIPPLRERKGDIVSLAHHFITYYAKKYNKPPLMLTDEQIAVMKKYKWPGNVRELKHVIERAVLVSESDRLELVFPNMQESPTAETPFSDFPSLDEIQRRYIRFVLDHTDGRISGPGNASDILDINRTTLNSRMRKLGMR